MCMMISLPNAGLNTIVYAYTIENPPMVFLNSFPGESVNTDHSFGSAVSFRYEQL